MPGQKLEYGLPTVGRENIHFIVAAVVNPGEHLNEPSRWMDVVNLRMHQAPGMNGNDRDLPERKTAIFDKVPNSQMPDLLDFFFGKMAIPVHRRQPIEYGMNQHHRFGQGAVKVE